MQNGSDAIFESHIRDLVIRSKKTGKFVFSEFLSDKERNIAQKVVNSLSCSFKFYGGYPEADNVMLSVYTDLEPSDLDFPIKCLKITVTNRNADLKHGDYMGAVMALGIERDVFGDIIACPTEAYIYVTDFMVDYFTDCLTDIGREKCNVSVMPDDFIPNTGEKFSEQHIIISSDRLDCFVSAICRLSRDKSAETVKRKLVYINGSEAKDPSKKLCEGDKLVIHGFGKYIIGSCDGKTHKDRLKITVKKYN